MKRAMTARVSLIKLAKWEQEFAPKDASKLEYIKFRDDSSYIEGRHWNGGGYIYYTSAERVNEEEFEIEYSSSSEFDFCKITGHFESCERCPHYSEAECEAPRQRLTVAEVQKMLDECNEEFYVVEYIPRAEEEEGK